MIRTVARGALATLSALSAAVLALPAAPAVAGSTATAPLVCGDGTVHSISGFGRGQVLHVEGSNLRFVVTSARLADGTLVFDAPGEGDRPGLLTCTTTPPESKNTFTFEGFLTPRA